MNELEVFSAALEIDSPEDRERYLAEVCGEDDALRERIEALLRSAGKANSFLELPPLDLSLEDTVDDRGKLPPGTTIGPYKLLQQIGEGGMGVVYMAEQSKPVERMVALKIIKPGMDTRHVIARFEAERQALALMDHPNIAKVLDAGTTPAGQPYFVMELVKGTPFTDYCDKHRLTPHERLELFLPVCHAVQHAHQKGIIHRDLKPTNLLVAQYDERPVAKIIDFGVAKAIGGRLTERTLFTEYGQVVGSIDYMSPEQAKLNQLDVDTRSDIYSLGILLYELLTGSTPFDKARLRSAAFDEMLRIIREEEPPKPSTRLTSNATLPAIAANRNVDPARLNKLVRGELDWIVMKCMEKDRSRRYETASSLALDIQRHLADEPVAACPPSAGYRFRKFARRHKGPVLAASLVLSALLVGIVTTSWQAIRATRAEQDAEGERARAEINAQRARQAVNEYLTVVSEDEALRHGPSLQPLRKKLLLSALPYYENLVREAPSDPKLRAEQAATCLRIGILTYEAGTGENWLEWFNRGVSIVEELLRDNHNLSALASLESGQRWIGGHVEGGSVLGFENVERSLDRARRVWEMLVRRYPTVPGFQHDLAAFYYALAGAQASNTQQSMLRNAQASAIWQKLVDAHPEMPHYRAALVQGLVSLTSNYVRLRQSSEAETSIRRAVHAAEALVADFPEDPGHRELVGLAYREFAYFLEHANRLDDAEQAWRNSLRVLDDLRRRYPTVQRYLLPVLVARIELGNLLWHTQQWPQAREQFDEVLKLDQQIKPDQLLERFWLAWFLADCFDPEIRDAQRAAETAEMLVREAPHVAEYGITLGIARYRMGQYQDAISMLEESIQPNKYCYFRDSAYARLFLAMAHQQLGETEISLEQYRAAIAQMETEYDWLWPRHNRAEAERELGLQEPSQNATAIDPQSPTEPAKTTSEPEP